MSQPVFEDDDSEVLHQPRAVPRVVWIAVSIVIAALAVAAGVARRHDHGAPHVLPSPVVTGPPSVRAATPAAPELAASDVLVPGRTSGFSTSSDSLTLETDVVNTSTTTLTVRYPITVTDAQHRVLAATRAGLYSRGSLNTAAVDDPDEQAHLTALRPGATAALVVMLPIDCRHLTAQENRTAELQALVHVPPAVGTAMITVAPVGTPFAEMIRSACAPA